MSAKKSSKAAIARRYAKALFELANEKKSLEAVEKDLGQIREILENSPELNRVLKNTTLSKEKLQNIFSEILKRVKVNKLTNNFCLALGANRRLEILAEVIKEFFALIAEQNGEMTVEVVSAVPLAKTQKSKIAEQLKVITGKKVEITEVVNKEILGGIIVKMGSQMLDNSINGKLERLKIQQKRAALPA